ncbi:DUF7130 family rubredoxin-like protein [Alicyclobacillus sp. ALC3]|uniref:DUF7130 family rubredoxin-like protein n=1 Tax=Alicyclobacillus sp. ALC3 TaxID=2796143 RepID=UPI0023796298|nr:CBS domain-containing protein [Alicyclobacillus sp. ALC3]WDL96153.1 CBS domain-containing protein [Alicyclobacillus sp. ALC3]
MNASEIMIETPVTLDLGMSIQEAASHAGRSTLDILPVVDGSGQYHGSVSKAALVENLHDNQKRVEDACCTDALVCTPSKPLEHFAHDAQSPVPHQTIMVVDEQNRFRGVVPHVHWAVDEAKTQSGYPRDPLEARTASMHLLYKCTDCGEMIPRNSGIPAQCPSCGAGPNDISLYTED